MSHSEPLIQIVDEEDKVIGALSMDEAKEKGKIHRIVRVMVQNSKGQLLLQKRSSLIPYPGMWDSSAAGHVDEGETYESAALRELSEEVGIKNVQLKIVKTYYYNENDFKNRDIRQFNRVFEVKFDNTPNDLSKDEVTEVKWFDLVDLKDYIKNSPQDFTPGFIKSIEECY